MFTFATVCSLTDRVVARVVKVSETWSSAFSEIIDTYNCTVMDTRLAIISINFSSYTAEGKNSHASMYQGSVGTQFMFSLNQSYGQTTTADNSESARALWLFVVVFFYFAGLHMYITYDCRNPLHVFTRWIGANYIVLLPVGSALPLHE